jgi:DMSO/TMAO reductase YedYZ molybdopterin-dependent catalytic subunit
MSEPPVSRGFRGKQRSSDQAARTPPGQHLVNDFPVLSAGPTPRIDLVKWRFALTDGHNKFAEWDWQQFNALPQTKLKTDIHCVTTWSKLDTEWQGVTFDDLLVAAGLDEPPTAFTMQHSYGGYTTNVPVEDLLDGKAMIATKFGGEPLDPEHGGPARMVVPHLYFWKSAKWISSIEFIDADQPGFWEELGYHIYGDPWREQRYAGD